MSCFIAKQFESKNKMCYSGNARRLLLLGLILGMSLTLLQAKEVNETDTEHQNQDNDDLHADFNQFDPNTTVYDAPASNSFEPNTTVSEAPAIIPMSDEFAVWGFTWAGAGNGLVPPGAVVGGRTSNGENLYIGRAYHGNDLLPGKVHPSHKRLYVSSGGREHYYNNYEVLVEVRRGFQIIVEEEENE